MSSFLGGEGGSEEAWDRQVLLRGARTPVCCGCTVKPWHHGVSDIELVPMVPACVPAVVPCGTTRVPLWQNICLAFPCGRDAAQSLLAQANLGTAAAFTIPAATAAVEHCQLMLYVCVLKWPLRAGLRCPILTRQRIMVGSCCCGTAVQHPGIILYQVALKRPTFGCAFACESGKASGPLFQGHPGLRERREMNGKRIADSPGLWTMTKEVGRR